MAKQKLAAGKEIDILTMGEVRSLMREWMVDVAKGLRPVTFSAGATVRADGTFEFGGSGAPINGGQMGPAPAFWWAIDRLSIRVANVAIGAFSVYHGAVNPFTLVRDVPATAGGYVAFTNRGLMLAGGEQIVVAGSGATPSAQITLAGSAIEIPQALLWRWLS